MTERADTRMYRDSVSSSKTPMKGDIGNLIVKFSAFPPALMARHILASGGDNPMKFKELAAATGNEDMVDLIRAYPSDISTLYSRYGMYKAQDLAGLNIASARGTMVDISDVGTLSGVTPFSATYVIDKRSDEAKMGPIVTLTSRLYGTTDKKNWDKISYNIVSRNSLDQWSVITVGRKVAMATRISSWTNTALLYMARIGYIDTLVTLPNNVSTPKVKTYPIGLPGSSHGIPVDKWTFCSLRVREFLKEATFPVKDRSTNVNRTALVRDMIDARLIHKDVLLAILRMYFRQGEKYQMNNVLMYPKSEGFNKWFRDIYAPETKYQLLSVYRQYWPVLAGAKPSDQFILKNEIEGNYVSEAGIYILMLVIAGVGDIKTGVSYPMLQGCIEMMIPDAPVDSNYPTLAKVSTDQWEAAAASWLF